VVVVDKVKECIQESVFAPRSSAIFRILNGEEPVFLRKLLQLYQQYLPHHPSTIKRRIRIKTV
jgi:hypothetical protein